MLVMSQDAAETVALRALAWLAGHEAVLPLFLETSGLAPADIAARAREPAFLIAVLDFVMQQDDWVMQFCDAAGLPYTSVDQARQSLPGGARVHWT